MAKYKLTDNGVQDTETGAFIPENIKNRHWQKYLKWAEDNTPDEEETTKEKADKQKHKKQQLMDRIIDLRIKMDAAEVENFTDYSIECENELIELRDDYSELD